MFWDLLTFTHLNPTTIQWLYVHLPVVTSHVVDWFRKESFILSTSWLLLDTKHTKRCYFCLFFYLLVYVSCGLRIRMLRKHRFDVKSKRLIWNKKLGCNLILLSYKIWCKPQKLCLFYNYAYLAEIQRSFHIVLDKTVKVRRDGAVTFLLFYDKMVKLFNGTIILCPSQSPCELEEVFFN